MRSRLLLPFAVLFLAIAWLTPSAARACSCIRPGPPAQEAEHAALVFEGRASAPVSEGNEVRYTFEVARVFKGEGRETVEIVTANNSAACGRNYAPGELYLVYAHGAEADYGDTLCSRSRKSTDAAEDFAALGEGTRPGQTTPDPDEPTAEPPRIEEPTTEPPPVAPKSGGCSVGHETTTPLVFLGLLALGGACRRRRARSL